MDGACQKPGLISMAGFDRQRRLRIGGLLLFGGSTPPLAVGGQWLADTTNFGWRYPMAVAESQPGSAF